MSLEVITDNCVIAVRVPASSTVASAKATILQECAGGRGHCHPSSVWLKSEGNGLNDDLTLEQCGVRAGATLSLHVRARGGGVCMGKPTVAPSPEQLHLSIERKQQEEALALVEKMTDEALRACDIEGNTLVHAAIRSGMKEVALKIIKRVGGDIIGAQNAEGKTALHLAIEHKQSEVGLALVEKMTDEELQACGMCCDR